MPVRISDYCAQPGVRAANRAQRIRLHQERPLFQARITSIQVLSRWTKKKYRIGADLIFDIDCDMLFTRTVEGAYFYALKLIDILRYVYGFEEVLAFSGRRGIYLYIQDFEAIRLNLEARRDIS
jgi:hypothetical protein